MEENKDNDNGIAVAHNSVLYVNTTVSTSFMTPLNIRWDPKDDITAYELAQCMNYLLHFRSIYSHDITGEKPEVLRHFKITDPNKK
jgi:hypothetical protein